MRSTGSLRVGIGAVALAVLTIDPGVALAQKVVSPGGYETDDAQLYRPTVDPGPFLGVYDSETTPTGRFSLGFHGSYAYEPLHARRRVAGRERDVALLDHLGTATLVGTIGLLDRFQLGLLVPGYFHAESFVQVNDRELGRNDNNLGDIRLNGKIDLLGPEIRSRGFGLAIVPEIGFPTGNRNEFAGTGQLQYGGLLAADYHHNRLHLGVNLGGFVRDEFGERGGGDSHEDVLRFGTGFAYDVAPRQAVLLSAYGVTDAGDPFGEEFRTPVEALLGYRFPAGPVDIAIGAGAGVNDGKRASTAKLVFGVTSPREALVLPVADLAGSQKSYVIEDHDRNGFVSPGDVIVYTVTVVNSGAGPARNVTIVDPVPPNTDFVPGSITWNEEPVDDSIGYVGAAPPRIEVRIPLLGADAGSNEGRLTYKVGIRRDVPAPFAVRNQAVVRAEDLAPVQLAAAEAEVFPVVAERERVIATETRLEVTEKIHFDFDKATIQPRSYPILGDVASVLRERPELRISIVGHTDAIGSDDYNLRLSQHRAEAVRSYLEEQGIDPHRLEAVGRGEQEPIASNETETGRAANRRVEFRIIR